MRTGSLVILLALLAVQPEVRADEVQDALKALGKARTPAARIAAVKKLGGSGAPRAAKALDHLLTYDDDAVVRVHAAHALGRTTAANATDLLVGQVLRGGPLAVRDAVAWAIGRRADASRALQKALDRRGIAVLERGLVLRAMGGLRDEATRLALEDALRSPNPSVAEAALHAYATRTDTRAEAFAHLARLLAESDESEILLSAMDIVEASPSEALRPALRRLMTFPEPAIQAAADHLLQRLDAFAAAPVDPVPPKKGGDRYGTPDVPPPIRPPVDVPVRSRHDIVYAIDVTGSTVMTLPDVLERVRGEIRLLLDEGLNLRVGVIAYRGGQGRRARQAGLEVLPLTYDPARVRAFLEELEPGGVDDRGASAALALETALDRMAWRRAARRGVRLIADGGLEDPDAGIRVVRQHYRADRTRTRVVYVLRTRHRVPPELDRLAKAGGTGAVEVVE